MATGGSNDFNSNVVALGYGLSIKDQLAHSFGLQLDVQAGKVKGSQAGTILDGGTHIGSFSTKYFQGAISGVVNVATIDYLRRKNAINFFVQGGAGLTFYQPTTYTETGATNPVYKMQTALQKP